MSDIERYEFDHLREQLYQLQDKIVDLTYRNELLEQAVELLTVEVNLIKTEGCWRYFENPNHKHKDKDE